MAGTSDTQISRRGAVALLATLVATVVTSVAAYGGLAHWRAQASHPAPAAQVVQSVPSAPAFPINEEMD